MGASLPPPPVGPFSSPPMPRVLGGPRGGGFFLWARYPCSLLHSYRRAYVGAWGVKYAPFATEGTRFLSRAQEVASLYICIFTYLYTFIRLYHTHIYICICIYHMYINLCSLQAKITRAQEHVPGESSKNPCVPQEVRDAPHCKVCPRCSEAACRGCGSRGSQPVLQGYLTDKNTHPRRRCETHVAYRDSDRIYHFFNALPSSA